VAINNGQKNFFTVGGESASELEKEENKAQEQHNKRIISFHQNSRSFSTSDLNKKVSQLNYHKTTKEQARARSIARSFYRPSNKKKSGGGGQNLSFADKDDIPGYQAQRPVRSVSMSLINKPQLILGSGPGSSSVTGGLPVVNVPEPSSPRKLRGEVVTEPASKLKKDSKMAIPSFKSKSEQYGTGGSAVPFRTRTHTYNSTSTHHSLQSLPENANEENLSFQNFRKQFQREDEGEEGSVGDLDQVKGSLSGKSVNCKQQQLASTKSSDTSAGQVNSGVEEGFRLTRSNSDRALAK